MSFASKLVVFLPGLLACFASTGPVSMQRSVVNAGDAHGERGVSPVLPVEHRYRRRSDDRGASATPTGVDRFELELVQRAANGTADPSEAYERPSYGHAERPRSGVRGRSGRYAADLRDVHISRG